MAYLHEDFLEESPSEDNGPKREVIILGAHLFQNSLLASVLSRELEIPCRSLETLEPAFTKNGGRRLALIDLKGADPSEDIAQRIGLILRMPNSGSMLAVFNSHREMRYYKDTILSLGIRGIFFENEPLEIFLKGVASILDGNQWFPRELLNQWIRQSRTRPADAESTAALTPREKEILVMVATGATNGEISRQMYISYHTVKTHLSNIYKKINVSNRLQASLWSSRNL